MRCFITRLIAVGYIHIYAILHKYAGLRLRGLGFALRKIKNAYVFQLHGVNYWFNPDCAAAYCVMPAGYWNEPETHLFLDKVLDAVTEKVLFIDVGASIGEMALPVAAHKKALHVIAFEPQAECALAISKSAQINNFSHVEVIQAAASDTSGFVHFASSHRNPTAASLASDRDDVPQVPCVTVDETVTMQQGLPIVLIDVEGHEPSVMRGATNFIRQRLPLIIFEYNHTSKQHFTLDDIRHILPLQYEYYRLRSDGTLDQDFSNSWNCVAVPTDTVFADICAQLMST